MLRKLKKYTPTPFKSKDSVYDKRAADHAVAFIECLSHTKGTWAAIIRRNKLDGQGKHPWKAEVNEDDTSVPAATISGWYTQVYEPTFAAEG